MKKSYGLIGMGVGGKEEGSIEFRAWSENRL